MLSLFEVTESFLLGTMGLHQAELLVSLGNALDRGQRFPRGRHTIQVQVLASQSTQKLTLSFTLDVMDV